MTPDRTTLLNRVAAGELSAEEAARLLQPAPIRSKAELAQHWLRVRITNLETGKPKVNVNLPLTWVEIGLKLGAQHEPQLAGIDFSDILAQIRAGASGKLIEVEELDKNERVEVFVD